MNDEISVGVTITDRDSTGTTPSLLYDGGPRLVRSGVGVNLGQIWLACDDDEPESIIGHIDEATNTVILWHAKVKEAFCDGSRREWGMKMRLKKAISSISNLKSKDHPDSISMAGYRTGVDDAILILKRVMEK